MSERCKLLYNFYNQGNKQNNTLRLLLLYLLQTWLPSIHGLPSAEMDKQVDKRL